LRRSSVKIKGGGCAVLQIKSRVYIKLAWFPANLI
jgi:hypothetical protein